MRKRRRFGQRIFCRRLRRRLRLICRKGRRGILFACFAKYGASIYDNYTEAWDLEMPYIGGQTAYSIEDRGAK